MGLFVWGAGGCSRSHLVAQVGSYSITDKDVTYRNQLIKMDYPNETRDLGLKQLTDTYTFAEILKNNGTELTDAMILAEEERIRTHSKMPEQLLEIRRIFGLDHDSYLKVYVLPVLAMRVLPYEFFPRQRDIQKSTLERAMKILQALRESSSDFRQTAKKLGFILDDYILSENSFKKMDGKPKTFEKGSSEERLAGLLRDMGRNKTSGKWVEFPFELETAWMLFRFDQIEGGKIRFQAGVVQKMRFSEWIPAQMARVKVQ